MDIKNLLINDLSEESKASFEKCIEILKDKNNILICAHASPDGDALGSTYALGYICKELGKNFTLYNESEVPDFLNFLPAPKTLENDLDNLSIKPELIVVLDCGDRNRLGLQADKVLKLAPSISIDHHLDNPNFGSQANWVDTKMAATGNAIAYIALELNIELKDELATCLYTTFVTDTGSFSYGNTNSRILITASKIVQNGLDPSTINSALSNQWTVEKMRLWSYLMSTFTVDENLSIAYSLVSRSILEEFSATKDDLEGFVEHLRKLKSTRIACVIREKSAFESKLSLRSQGNDDVQFLCSLFGGGGHKNASGATIKSSLADSRDALLEALKSNKEKILE